MCCPRRSAERPGASRRQAGFTLIELMVGVLIGLLASLAVTHVLVNSEGQKRTTTASSDAQINGALALGTLQRAIQPAGYGFGAIPGVVGCALSASFNGAAVAGFPANLVPVIITDGAGGAPDSIRVLASGKSSFSIPLRITAPGYNPADPLLNQAIPVSTVRGIEGPQVAGGTPVAPGDLVVAAVSAAQPCELFQVTADPGATPAVPRADDVARWNPVGYPAGSYADGSVLINLGEPVDVTYSIAGNGLRARTLQIAANGTPSYDGPVELFPEIVNLQAFYGKDTDGNGSVDQWDAVTPTTNAGWLQVIAVRVAVVARSTQFEKENVTFANPQWDVGTAGTFPAATGCGASRCIELDIDGLADWQRYRYRVFDTVVPLRNMIWNS